MTIIDQSDPFPLHCELAVREFKLYRDSKAIEDPIQRRRQMRYHLEQALATFKDAQACLVETANRAMGAEIVSKEQSEWDERHPNGGFCKSEYCRCRQ